MYTHLTAQYSSAATATVTVAVETIQETAGQHKTLCEIRQIRNSTISYRATRSDSMVQFSGGRETVGRTATNSLYHFYESVA